VREVGYAGAFSFNYSARPGTPSAAAEDQVEESVKLERLYALQELIEEQRRAFNRAMVGRVIEVLFDKPGRHEGQLAGKSPYLQPVHVEPRDAEAGGVTIGAVRKVLVTAALPNSLAGRLVGAGEL
jgi:tRNA-2-methylthio-N6-dimethylallyladenosine synthase